MVIQNAQQHSEHHHLESSELYIHEDIHLSYTVIFRAEHLSWPEQNIGMTLFLTVVFFISVIFP